MNSKKAEMGDIGLILVMFIAVLVGLILFAAIAQNVGLTRDLGRIDNETVTTAANGSTITLNGKLVSGLFIYNATGDPAATGGNGTGNLVSNFTLTNNVLSNGELIVTLRSDHEQLSSASMNVSYDYQPLTFIAESGTRSIAGIIIIFTALAVFVASIPRLRDMFGL